MVSMNQIIYRVERETHSNQANIGIGLEVFRGKGRNVLATNSEGRERIDPEKQARVLEANSRERDEGRKIFYLS